MAYKSLQLCTSLEADIEGATHAVAQRRREKTLQVPEGRAYGDSADEIRVAVGGAESFGGAAAVVSVREVTVPPGGRLTQEEVEGGASNELRTAMEVMEVGGDNMDKG